LDNEEIKIGDLVEIDTVIETIRESYGSKLRKDLMRGTVRNLKPMRLGIVIGVEELLDEWYNKQPQYRDGLFVVMTDSGENQKYFSHEIRKVKVVLG